MSNYYDDIDTMEGFQKTIRVLTRERFNKATNSNEDTPGPREIATVLYDDYFEYVMPRGTTEKHSDTREKTINSITRRVQDHFNYIEPYKVRSDYMYAYSLLFNCSLDYLYGKTTMITPDVETQKICEVTGLSPDALENIMCKKDINIKNPDSNLPDYIFIEEQKKYSFIEFWNKLLSEEIYFDLPTLFYSLCESVYWKNKMTDEYNKFKKSSGRLPSEEKFTKIINNYNDDYETDILSKVYNYNGSVKTFYKNNKDKCKEIIKGINMDIKIEIESSVEDFNTAYYVDYEKLHRYVNNFLDDLSEKNKPKVDIYRIDYF